jgi:hypothetical protein
MSLRIPALVAALLVALPAGAILIRADRDDAEYLELASRYPSAVPLAAPDGEGVLVAPRWILTSAQVARALQAARPAPRLAFAGGAHAIQSFFIHPEWRGGAAADVALVLLREPVHGIEPSALYRASDESGKAVVIVGHGSSGKIGEPALPRERWDRRKRAAINTVDRVSPQALELQIKSGDEASDLQGAGAPGESGRPAFLETPAGIFVAGVGSAGAPPWERYARVSAFAPWIDAVMLAVARDEAERLLDDRQVGGSGAP